MICCPAPTRRQNANDAQGVEFESKGQKGFETLDLPNCLPGEALAVVIGSQSLGLVGKT